ncbi:glycosyltransferase [Aeromonas bestiarum]|uniref:glycosyltransferase family 2 protein n=1 Tax=Aeromonas bestiarum TaxID=105751 RepID=UPI002377F6B7|nr:glycosyltransferase [Aeromonas bestiarum]WDL83943.1 glycosyltransferase [Aeromonas bestiarum]
MSEKSPTVSVIMPVYNVGLYILDAVNSILNQTYKDLELIIVDDSSTDDTYKVLIDNFSKNEKIKILKNSENKKIVYSLNKALGYASGEFIARIDGDDIAYPDRIEKQINYLLQHPKVDLVGCDIETINERGVVTGAFNRFPEHFDILNRMAYFCPPVSHIWLCRASVYKSLNGYRFPSVEDYDFLLRMITSGYKFANIPGYVGMKIRIRDGSTSTLFGVSQRRAFNFVRQLYNERLRFGIECTDSGDFSRYINSSRIVKLHSLSNALCKRAVLSNSSMKYILFLMSAIVSPYQAQYIYCRVRAKIIIWRASR